MTLLLISNEAAVVTIVEAYARNGTHQLTIARDLENARTRLAGGEFDAVLVDCSFRAAGLIDLTEDMSQILTETVVLLIGPLDHEQRRRLSERLSAHYSIDKPLRKAAFEDAMARVFQRSQIVRTTGLIGRSPAMEETIQTIIQIGPTPISVLITGESGTGKEVVARALHTVSLRKNRPFLAVNCAALAEGVLESELFGHEKGAFTGAANRRIGMFEKADGGTIFLDEIGEIAPSTQIRLLRVLEEREIMRVGGTDIISVDVRVIAATNRNLRDLVESGGFRRDLYYRIKVLELHVPPLRERPEDVPLLINRLARLYALANNTPPRRFDDTAITYLVTRNWAGNVRELRNFVESCLALTTARVIGMNEIPSHLLAELQTPANLPAPTGIPAEQFERELIYRTLIDLRNDVRELRELLTDLPTTREHVPARDMEIKPVFQTTETLEDMERDAIMDALEQTGGNRRITARILGIGERTLYRKLKQYGLK